MQILVLVTGEYGLQHVQNLNMHAPLKWSINSWQTPSVLPETIENPADYLPPWLPPTHLILSLAEAPGVADLLPTIAQMTGAEAIIAPIDNPEWLPFERARHLSQQCAEIGVTCVSPMPLCSLTETHVNVWEEWTPYDHPLIRGFSRYFGRPEFQIEVDPAANRITHIYVTRDTGCGCARHIAAELNGSPLRKAFYRTARFHRCYPCLASPRLDMVYGDTLQHISNELMQDAIKIALGEYAEGIPTNHH